MNTQWPVAGSFGDEWSLLRRLHTCSVITALDFDRVADEQVQKLLLERRVLQTERDTYEAAIGVLERQDVLTGARLLDAEIRGWTRDALRVRAFVAATVALDYLH